MREALLVGVQVSSAVIAGGLWLLAVAWAFGIVRVSWVGVRQARAVSRRDSALIRARLDSLTEPAPAEGGSLDAAREAVKRRRVAAAAAGRVRGRVE